MSVAISLNAVSHWYGDVIALNDISLHIESGVAGLVGPNGAGKTTLLRLLTGQIRPTSGRVKLGEATVWGNPTVLSQVGYCPETDHFYEHQSALEFVTLMTRLYGFSWTDARERARDALAQVRLDDQAASQKQIGDYSKGMRQKVKIAQALAHDPRILILDEPLTGVDALSRHQISTLIRTLGEQGRTVLLSSHVLHEVESVTAEFILINRGRLIAEGNVYEIRDLIDNHPHRIDVVCSDARRLAATLAAQAPGDLGLHIQGAHQLILHSETPATLYSLLPRAARDSQVVLQRLTSPDNNLEAVFRYLTQA